MTGKGDKKRRRALEAYARLQRVATFSAAFVDQAVHPFGLSASQFGVLDTLLANGPVHQQGLAEALGRSKAQMTAIIDALEARGLVRRERHPTDRRYLTVHVTEAGTALHGQAAPARTEAVVALMSELTGEQRARLSRLCRKLLRTVDPKAAQGDADEDDDATDGSEATAASDTPEVGAAATGTSPAGGESAGGQSD
jgi:MarR family 2-MHQ and catechol resistance regulon transcriptional repressor